jgi:hypothetical protein
MSGDHRIVGHDDVVADTAIVRHMRVSKKEAPIADDRLHGPVTGAGMHGDAFAYDAIGADRQGGRLPGVFQILRSVADHGEREDRCAGADAGVACNDDVALQVAAIA